MTGADRDQFAAELADFAGENWSAFVAWLENMGYENPEDYANEHMPEIYRAAGR